MLLASLKSNTVYSSEARMHKVSVSLSWYFAANRRASENERKLLIYLVRLNGTTIELLANGIPEWEGA